MEEVLVLLASGYCYYQSRWSFLCRGGFTCKSNVSLRICRVYVDEVDESELFAEFVRRFGVVGVSMLVTLCWADVVFHCCSCDRGKVYFLAVEGYVVCSYTHIVTEPLEDFVWYMCGRR